MATRRHPNYRRRVDGDLCLILRLKTSRRVRVDGDLSATTELSDDLDLLGNRASSQAQAGPEEPVGPIGKGGKGLPRVQ